MGTCNFVDYNNGNLQFCGLQQLELTALQIITMGIHKIVDYNNGNMQLCLLQQWELKAL